MTRLSFLDLPVDPLTMTQTVERCHALIQKRGAIRADVNASIVVDAQENALLKDALWSADIVNADGNSVVVAGKFLGLDIPERVTGVDLMQELVDRSLEWRVSVFLLGARPEVVERLAKMYVTQGVDIVGYRDGFWPPEEELNVVKQVRVAEPDILFIALPSPRKEYFILQNNSALNAGIVVGVGGAFDVIAGDLRRAPLWIQKCGAEWIFRLAQEPKRLFRRYLVGNSKFLILTFRARWRKSFPNIR